MRVALTHPVAIVALDDGNHLHRHFTFVKDRRDLVPHVHELLLTRVRRHQGAVELRVNWIQTFSHISLAYKRFGPFARA